MNHCMRKIFLFVALVLPITFILACAGTSDKDHSAQQQWQKMAQENRGYSPPPRRRDLTVMPKKIETIDPLPRESKTLRKLPTRTITMKMHQTEVAVLLRALARAVDLNIMINESVKGRISINVSDAKWNQVFMSILKAQGLSYEWEGDIIRIITGEDRDRNFKNLEAEGKILAKKREMELQAPLVTKIIPIDFASAEDLKANIEKLLAGNKDEKLKQGSVLVDKQTNTLIVQATATDITRVVALVTQLDRPTQQILIEAHIVETSNRTARELGIQWGGLYYDSGRNFWITPNAIDALTNTTIGGTLDPEAGSAINFPANLNNATQSGTGMQLGIIGQSTNLILATQLSALEEDGRLNILSSPSITTLDNIKATIESGSEIPIPVLEQGETANVIYKQALLSLAVTPHVIQSDALKLEIVTTKNEVDFSKTVLTYPTIISKKASTNVILFDGQTTVIGGLKKNTSQKSDAGVPWLSKIPLLGYLFKNESKSEQMEEILIFITPHILKTRPAPAPAPRDNS